MGRGGKNLKQKFTLKSIIVLVILVFGLFLYSYPVLADLWNIETVDSESKWIHGGNSIALDDSGNPSISYDASPTDFMQSVIKYAKWTGSKWDIETVDSAGNLGLSKLAIDSSNNPHIAYTWVDATGYIRNLKYAKWTGSKWDIETVDSAGGDTGKQPSLALDSSNNPHIAYVEGTYTIKYAKWTGSKWDITTVSSGGYSLAPSLALDSSNNPHIAYPFRVGSSDTVLKYAKWTGSKWDITTVDPGDPNLNRHGGRASLVLDTNDNPHISYDDCTKGSLKYAKWTGSKWDIETVDSPTHCARPFLALDSSNNPHIAYVSLPFSFKYAKWTGSKWDIETISSGSPGPFSLAISSGKSHIAYTPGYPDYDLRYTKKTFCVSGSNEGVAKLLYPNIPPCCPDSFDPGNGKCYTNITGGLDLGADSNENACTAALGTDAWQNIAEDNKCCGDDSSRVTFWHMDEGSGAIVVDSIGANYGSFYSAGNPTDLYTSNSKEGISALSFDGIDDYVEVGDSSSLDITDAITVEAWIKADTLNPAKLNLVIHKTPYDGKGGYGIYHDRVGGKICFYINDWFNNRACAPFSPGSWHHIVGTYDKNLGSHQIKIYKDGVRYGRDTYTASITTNTQPLSIGGVGSESIVGWCSWNGTIDEVAIYNKALSADEIKKNYLGETVEAYLNYDYGYISSSGQYLCNYNGTDWEWKNAQVNPFQIITIDPPAAEAEDIEIADEGINLKTDNIFNKIVSFIKSIFS